VQQRGWLDYGQMVVTAQVERYSLGSWSHVGGPPGVLFSVEEFC
jgi:hypothetical protein